MKINEIRIDGSTQPRTAINENVVSEYTEVLLEGGKFPPVVVFDDGIYKWLADGFHRFHAHKRAKLEDIEVEIKKGTVRDAVEFSLGANADHGLPRTIDDKRKAVKTVLDDMEWGELSDREIARMCRVSHGFVAKVKKELISKTTTKATKPEKKEEKPSEVQVSKPVEEYTENDKLAELAKEHVELAEENARLLDKLAVKNMDATPEQKQEALETLESLRATIKQLEIDNHSLTVSRNQFQAENAELKKQVRYWRNKAEKASK